MIRGKLILQENDRFGVVVTELTSGQPCKIFIDDELKNGRIEHLFTTTYQGYVFIDTDNRTHYLENGIEVLID